MPIPEEEWNLPLTLLILSWVIQVLGILVGYGVASAMWFGISLAAGYTVIYFSARWIVRRFDD